VRRTNWRTLAPWLAAVAILALAAGLRFFRLDAQSLWNDEGTAAALAWRDLATIARNASDDIHPPLYYWLLSLWVRLAGDSEFALRSLSALMSVATVGLTMRLARRWFGSGTALLAGLLLAVSPLAVYYAQEARMYAQVTFMGAAAMLALTRALPASEAEPALQPGRLLVYGLAMLATLYSHYYAAALLLAHNLAFVAWLGLRRGPGRCPWRERRWPWRERRWPWRERRWPWRELGRWALTQALILALYAPWLAFAWHTIRHWPSISAPFTFGELVLRLAQALPLGITVHTAPWTLAVGAALAALAALGLSRSAEGLAGSRGRWYPVIAVALYAGVPVGLMYAASLQRPMYNPKFLLLATPAYVLLLARGLETLAAAAGRWLGRRAASATLALALLAVLAPLGVSLRGLYSDPAFARDDYRGMVAYIEAAARPGDALLINAPAQIETVHYYDHGALPTYPLPQTRPADRAATEAELADILARHQRIYAILWATDESDPKGIVEGYLAAHAYKALDSWHGNVRLAVYSSARQAPATPAVTTAWRLGDASLREAIALEGYALLTPELAAGDVAQVTLFWRAAEPVSQRLKVFVHLVDAQGHIVGQHDAEPAGGGRPTTAWAVGELVRDNHGVLVQPGTPPGELTLRVGLYDATTGQRWSVSRDGQAQGNAIDLATLPLQAPAEPLPIEAFDVEVRREVELGEVAVLGYSLYPLGLRHEARRTLRPGETAELVLYTRGAVEPLEVWLLGRGRVVATARLAAPGADLPARHIARSVVPLAIPADAPAGRYTLGVNLGGQRARLGKVQLTP
jgi:mannosyltransferase